MRQRLSLAAVALFTSLTLAACKTPGSAARLRAADGSPEAASAATAAQAREAVRKALHYLFETQVKEPDQLAGPVRLEGEWASYVRGSVADDSNLQALYDSNAFVPMFVTYPFFLMDDKGLPAGGQKLSEMSRRTLKLLRRWYLAKNGEVNFWPTIAGFHGPQQIAEALPFARLLGPIFDIANDADDTAVYYVTALKMDPGSVDKDFPKLFAGWLDKDRARRDEREAAWKPDGTGAYMTWMSDEDKPGNKHPIAFKLANNVDCLVLGNVLYAVGLNRKLNGGAAEPTGYKESCALAREVIEKKSYPACALYYPPQWLFPYAVSRAFRDGGNDCLQPSMKPLAQEILAAQKPDGSWDDVGVYANLPADVQSKNPEFRGDARVYSTALNVSTLANVGVAEWPDPAAARAAIESGVRFLVANVVKDDGKEFWQGGVFFSSSYQTVARWKSRPYTTAVVLEAMVKYLRHYGDGDEGGVWKLTENDVPSSWLIGEVTP